MEKELIKYMTIGLTANDNECGVNISPDMDATTALQLVGTLALHILNAFSEIAIASVTAQLNEQSASEGDIEAATTGIKESLYDAMDNIFSNVLDSFLPTSPRSDIEEEAILELVNKKIEERYDALSDSEKEAYSVSYNKMLESLKTKSEDSTDSTEDTEE